MEAAKVGATAEMKKAGDEADIAYHAAQEQAEAMGAIADKQGKEEDNGEDNEEDEERNEEDKERCAGMCPTGICDGPADAGKTECQKCAVCMQQGDTNLLEEDNEADEEDEADEADEENNEEDEEDEEDDEEDEEDD